MQHALHETCLVTAIQTSTEKIGWIDSGIVIEARREVSFLRSDCNSNIEMTAQYNNKWRNYHEN